MNKLFLKLSTLSVGLMLAVGAGALISNGARAQRADAATVLAYTLDGTVTGGAGNYSAKDITQSEITWNVTANASMNPWRLGGGKSTTFSDKDMPIYSKGSLPYGISKIEVESGTRSNITINSLTISVHANEDDAADGSNPISSKTETTYSNIIGKVVTFEKPSDKDWTNRYYRIVYNLTKTSTSSAGYIQFASAKFSYEEDSVAPDTVTVTGDSSVAVGETIALASTATKGGSTSGVNQNVVWSSDDEKIAVVSSSGVVTGISNGNVAIKATAEDDNTVVGQKVITVNGGKVDDKGFVVLPDDFPESYGDSGIVVDGVYLHRVHIMKNSGLIQVRNYSYSSLLENVAPFGSDISRIEIAFNSEKDQGTGYVVSVSADGETFTPLSATAFDTNKAVYVVDDTGYTYFKLTGPTSNTLYLDSIFVGLSNTKEVNMIPLAKTLNDMLDDDCKGDSDTSNITSARWSEIEAAYVAGDADGKAGLAAVSGFSYFEVNKFIERYDYIISTYHYSNFLSRSFDSIETKVASTNDNAAIIVIVVASFSLLAASTWFILRKKKLSK